MAVRQLLEITPGSPEVVTMALREYQDWRVVGFSVTQGDPGTTAWILIEADENIASRPMRALGALLERG